MKKIEEWLVTLYFFICPCELVLNIAIRSSTKYIGILILVVWLVNLFNDPKPSFTFSKGITSLVIWLAYCVISLAWGNESELTFDYLTSYLEMGLLVFILVQKEWSEKNVRHFLFAYYLGSICLAIATLTFGETRYLGRIAIVFMGRTIDPNQVPANIIPGAIISLGYSINNRIKIHYRIIATLTFLLTIYTIFINGSRGAFLALGGGLLFTYFLQPRGVNINKILYIGFFMVLVWFALSLLPSETTDRILGFDTYANKYANGENRLTIWESLLDTFDAQWIMGHGVGSTIAYFKILVGKLRGTHNTFLLVLYEVGFIGFGFFIFTFISMLASCIKARFNIATGILVASLITSFFLDSLILRYLWNGLVLCIMCNATKQSTQKAEQLDQRYVYKYIREDVSLQARNNFIYIK